VSGESYTISPVSSQREAFVRFGGSNALIDAMKYSSDKCKKRLAPYAGSACADPDLANDIVNCNLGAAIGRLARMACGLKRPRPLPTKGEWEKEQSKSEVANARRSVNVLTRRDRGCEAPS